jgi:hypothetical protein
MNALAAIGHNQPADPFTAFSLHLDDLEEQAKQFLDGTGVQTPEQAEDVSRLLGMVRKAANDAEDARKAEKKPHDDAAKAVQARWKPILEKADLIAGTAKQALAPFLQRQEDANRAAAEAAAQEAREKAHAAAQAIQQARPDDLAGQSTARILQENAADAAKRAERLGKVKVQARGGERAVGLRSTYRAEITDPTAFARWMWANRNAEMLTFLEEVAQRECRGGPRGIPGITVHEERKAV